MGTAVALMVRRSQANGTDKVSFRHIWGKTKRADLLASADNDGVSLYDEIHPSIDLGLPFFEITVGTTYLAWPLLTDLLPVSFPGVQSKRDDIVVDIDREVLAKRIEAYFDPTVSDSEMGRLCPKALESTQQFKAPATRAALIKRGLKQEYFVRYCYRPFDLRWIYWEQEHGLLGRRSPDYFANVQPGDPYIEARQKQPMADFDRGYVTSIVADNFGNGFSNFFPLHIHQEGNLLGAAALHPNVSDAAQKYLAGHGVSAEELFYHVVAVLHSPAYRTENQGALRQDWPRIPLPASTQTLNASATLGRQIAALLDTYCSVKGVSEAPFRKELQAIAVIERDGKSAVNPDEGDLELTAGWGHAGKGGATMPGKGKAIERPYTPQEGKALADSVTVLGERTVDVYLNDRVCWRNVPIRLWDYTISGYAVIKKWLSYREKELLGRSLSVDEARYVTETVRRLAALMLLGPQLDDNYRTVIKDAHKW